MSINSSWLDDFVRYLQISGIGTEGTDLFVGAFSPSAKNGVLVVPFAGKERKTSNYCIEPYLQILSRNYSFSSAMSKACSVYNLLDKKGNVVSGSTSFMYFVCIGVPFSIGKDEQDLWRIVFDVRVKIR